MKLGRLALRAKQVMDQRGGSEALKKDAEELRDIARAPGDLKTKAKRAAEALREPGASDRETPDATTATAPQDRPGEPPAPPRG